MENPAPAPSQVKEDKLEQGEITEVEDSEETFGGKSINLDHKRIRALLKQETLTLDERLELLLTVGEECISEPELKKLLEAKEHPICYDGFEPSGRMHIAQGILKAINVNKCTKSGCTFIFWVADWFALLNNKMDGNLSKIKTVGEYMIEVWKACGMDMNNVKFVWTSDEINSHSNEYWLKVMDIARRFSIKRIMRCGQIMGRKEGEELFASQIFYPCMQCADIFHLKADICQLGLDQRKVNMLAREYCTAVKIKHKPIILSHHMIMGLAEGQEKMSKSNPDSAIFMEDEQADINSKIKKSYCPPKIVEKNPCFDYLKWFVFQKFEEFVVSRDEKNGGIKTYTSYDDVVKDYEAGLLHPGDLKPALAKAINAMIQPVREHFQKDPRAKELLKKVKSFKVTR